MRFDKGLKYIFFNFYYNFILIFNLNLIILFLIFNLHIFFFFSIFIFFNFLNNLYFLEAAVVSVNRIFRAMYSNEEIKKTTSKLEERQMVGLFMSKEVIPLTQEQLSKLSITMEDFHEALKKVQPSSKREGKKNFYIFFIFLFFYFFIFLFFYFYLFLFIFIYSLLFSLIHLILYFRFCYYP